MMENFPYDLLQKNASKNKGDKKSGGVADSNDGSVVNQINLSLVLLYLDFASGQVDDEFAQKVIGYLQGQYIMLRVLFDQACFGTEGALN